MSKLDETVSMRGARLALQRARVLDIPPRTRLFVALVGTIGVVLVIVGSLEGPGGFVATDKLLHFTGYSVLGFVFVLALPAMLWVPGLFALAGLGGLIEVLQPSFGRSRDSHDLLANLVGVAIGGAVGYGARTVHAYLRRELSQAEARARMKRYGAGSLIYSQGEPQKELHVIQQGLVEITREVDGTTQLLATAEPGDVIGILGVVLGEPNLTTATAVAPTTLYPMKARELLERAGDAWQPTAAVITALAEMFRHTRLELERAEGRPEGERAVVAPEARPHLREEATLRTKLRLQHHDPGDVIYRQGDAAREIYVIDEGEVNISRENNGQTEVVATAESGDVIGVLGAALGMPQPTTATAAVSTTVMPMDAAELLGRSEDGWRPTTAVIRSLAATVEHMRSQLEGREAEPRPETEG